MGARCQACGAVHAWPVFEEEPTVHPGLMPLDNVVLAPHIGSASREARSKMAEVAATCLVAMMRGECPPQCVNPAVFGGREV